MTAFAERHNWLLAHAICTRRDFVGEEVGGNCGQWFAPALRGDRPGCGHPNVLHIGRDCCLTCEMNAVLGELRQQQAAT